MSAGSAELAVPAAIRSEDGTFAIPATWDRWVVAGLVVLSAAIRLPNLGRAYWVDEGISVGIASHHLSQIPGLLRLDGSPPLFYLLLHWWMQVFGTAPAETHLFPLSASLVVIPLGYWAGRTLFDRRAGLAAAALFATNAFLNWYSTETRMYPMLVVLSLVAITFTARAVRGRAVEGTPSRHPVIDATAAVLAFTALLYTHNWGLYVAGATGALLLWRAYRRGDRPLAVATVLAGAIVLVLFAPWVPTLWEQAHHTAAPWAVPPGIGDLFADPATALGGTIQFLVAPALVLGVWTTRRQLDPETRSAATLIGGIAAVAIISGWVLAHPAPSWTVRYLAVVVAPLLLGAAGALAPTRRGRQVVAAVCAALTLWTIIGSLIPNPNNRYAKSNVAAVAAAAAPDLHRGDLVIVNQTEQLAVLAHYLPKGLLYATPTGLVRDPYVVDWYDLVPRLAAANACRNIAPLLRALPAGAHVLEISPVRPLGPSGSKWYRVVNAQVRDIDYLLGTDPSMVAARSLTEALHPTPFSPVIGELFVKTAGATPCHLPPPSLAAASAG